MAEDYLDQEMGKAVAGKQSPKTAINRATQREKAFNASKKPQLRYQHQFGSTGPEDASVKGGVSSADLGGYVGNKAAVKQAARTRQAALSTGRQANPRGGSNGGN